MRFLCSMGMEGHSVSNEYYSLQLIVNNGALNSSSVFIEVDLFPLVPAPARVALTDTFLSVRVSLPGEERYQVIQSIALLVGHS